MFTFGDRHLLRVFGILCCHRKGPYKSGRRLWGGVAIWHGAARFAMSLAFISLSLTQEVSPRASLTQRCRILIFCLGEWRIVTIFQN